MKNITLQDLTLTQDAQIAGTKDNPHYEAHATDKDGNEYQVTWYISCDDCRTGTCDNDESHCCDWDNPSAIIAL